MHPQPHSQSPKIKSQVGNEQKKAPEVRKHKITKDEIDPFSTKDMKYEGHESMRETEEQRTQGT